MVSDHILHIPSIVQYVDHGVHSNTLERPAHIHYNTHIIVMIFDIPYLPATYTLPTAHQYTYFREVVCDDPTNALPTAYHLRHPGQPSHVGHVLHILNVLLSQPQHVLVGHRRVRVYRGIILAKGKNDNNYSLPTHLISLSYFYNYCFIF